jgi:hemolysin activation/secretion protein
VIVRGAAQLSADRLLPAEKLAVGGAHTVRGYRENLLVRDNGWVASVELRYPLLELEVPLLGAGRARARLELAPCYDIGRAWEVDVASPEPTTIHSVGIGLRAEVPERFTAAFYYGRRLREIRDPSDRDLQDAGVHFAVQARF